MEKKILSFRQSSSAFLQVDLEKQETLVHIMDGLLD